MKLLLDTPTFFWWLAERAALPSILPALGAFGIPLLT